MGFNEIMGQDKAIELIKAGFLTGRISHAYLFFGQQGVGKFKTAQIMARLLNCESPTSDSEPCDCCVACLKAISGNHPDIIVTGPDGKAIKIAQMRALQEKANYKCYEGNYKVILIDEVELLTAEAANSLLKVLEEPPDNTVFILSAQDTIGLPATILSRCQPVPFRPLSENTIAEILKEQGLQSSFPLTVAKGSVGKAMQMLQSYDGEQLISNITQLLMGLGEISYQEIFRWAETMEKDRDLLEVSLDVMAAIYRDRLITGLTKDERLILINQDFPGKALDKAAYLKALENIIASRQLLNGNANIRLVLEVLMIRLRNIESERKGA